MTRSFKVFCLIASIFLVAFIAGCGGGGNSVPSAAPSDDSGGMIGDVGPPPATVSAPVHCDGLMLSGSARWCKQDDGTVKDMTTGTVWLRDAGCAGWRVYSDAVTWTTGLASGVCGLTDASKAGDWAIPDASGLLALTQGAEPVSEHLAITQPAPGSGPQAFNNVDPIGEYWTSTASKNLPGWQGAVVFGDYLSGFGKYPYFAPAINSLNVLPYRRYTDNRSTTLDAGQGYALAASTASIAVPGTSNGFTRRFVNQIQWTYGFNASYVVLWDWDENSIYRTYRIWYFVADNTGYFRIRTQPWTGGAWDYWRYLAVENASTSAGAHVVAWPDPGGDNHLWFLHLNADNTWWFQNKHSGMCLQWQSNANNQSLEQRPCAAGSPNQSFIAFPRQ
ncbi:MAG: RICIN domain-containing protein [Rhodoferax sp.]|uniref:RICIN domain-containing protein n=1 Tax=Rhodoferax sp. TaxID=50421 RepID=UPI0026220565|nr:RICIN domain-containing protein [Rhodoferax sp.]MDD5333074.1 RICIN domain-containing protein [Rhodoferax sp.]